MSRFRLHPWFLMAVGVVFISLSAILVKLSTAPATVIAAWRLLIAACLMLPLWWWKHRGEIRKISRRDWGLSFLSGVFLAFHFALWFASLSYTSVASSVVLVTLQPVFSFVGAYLLFGERSRPAALASAGIAMAGGMILGWGDFASGGMAWFGDSLALAGAGMVTAYWLMGQNLRTRMSTVTYTLIVYSTAGLLLAGVTLAFSQPLFSYPSRDWWLFFLLALFPTLLGHSLLNWVIRWIPATTVSVAILGEPIGASLLAWIIFSEQPGVFQWIGGLFIIIGVYGFLRYKETSEKPGTAHSQTRQGDSL